MKCSDEKFPSWVCPKHPRAKIKRYYLDGVSKYECLECGAELPAPTSENSIMEKWESVLEICLYLHMHHNGASDPLDAETYAEYLQHITNRLSNWREGQAISKQFDDAVKSLIQATIAECNAQLPAPPIEPKKR